MWHKWDTLLIRLCHDGAHFMLMWTNGCLSHSSFFTELGQSLAATWHAWFSNKLAFSLFFVLKLYPNLLFSPSLYTRGPLIQSQHFICPDFLFQFYFNSFTYLKIMKFLSKFFKFMMIILNIFNSHFAPIFLNQIFFWSYNPFFIIVS
jgi:hypothetical protein